MEGTFVQVTIFFSRNLISVHDIYSQYSEFGEIATSILPCSRVFKGLHSCELPQHEALLTENGANSNLLFGSSLVHRAEQVHVEEPPVLGVGGQVDEHEGWLWKEASAALLYTAPRPKSTRKSVCNQQASCEASLLSCRCTLFNSMHENDATKKSYI